MKKRLLLTVWLLCGLTMLSWGRRTGKGSETAGGRLLLYGIALGTAGSCLSDVYPEER